MRDYIDANALRDMILCAAASLRDNQQQINELNVFPVPDGDTGTNMSLTIGSAVTEFAGKSFASVGAVAEAAASALLRGARGNSGVILSLLFRGIGKTFKGLDTADARQVAAALAEGTELAYKAVMKPAEGTILTVSRVAARAAAEQVKAGGDVEAVLESALRAGEQALTETVHQNPVLEKAGVVDAGGRGYVVLLDAMLASLQGRQTAGVPEAESRLRARADWSQFETEDINFSYETVFIVNKARADVLLEPLRTYLDSIGDSLVISEDDSLFKVHVHTNDPGLAIAEAQKYGTLDSAKIDNLRYQHDELVEQELRDEAVSRPAAPEKRCGVVAVCSGQGFADLFRELGADGIVTGGQTMNPSTEDILAQVLSTPAETVFVLPNNKNIIMAAQQCVPLVSDRRVVVIGTTTVPQGVSAMLNMDPDADPEALAETFREAAAQVHTAQITYAARDSDYDGHCIHAGEYLAMLDGRLVGSYDATESLAAELTAALAVLNPSFLTLYYGQDVTEEQARVMAAALEADFPEAELNVVNGGQPVYYYLIAAE